jgi:hypothetical protein
MDAFEDIDFASIRPIRTHSPPSRPDAAPVWHRREIRDEEATVVRLLALNANRIAVLPWAEVREIVDSKYSSPVSLDVTEFLGDSLFSGLIVDAAVSWIRGGEVIPAVKER